MKEEEEEGEEERREDTRREEKKRKEKRRDIQCGLMIISMLKGHLERKAVARPIRATQSMVRNLSTALITTASFREFK